MQARAFRGSRFEEVSLVEYALGTMRVPLGREPGSSRKGDSGLASPRLRSAGHDAPTHSLRGLRYRRLGKWGVKVSEIGLGSWLTYGGSVEDEQATACIHRAFELGVNFFDTAN